MEGVRDRPVCRLLRVLVVGTGGAVQQRSGIVWIEASAVLIASAQGQLPAVVGVVVVRCARGARAW